LYRSKVPSLNEELLSWWGRCRMALRYVTTRRGQLSISVNQAVDFIRSRPDQARVNLQLYFSPVSYVKAGPGKRQLQLPEPYPDYLTRAQRCRPSSRGHRELGSADPLAAPRISPTPLATEEDQADMLEATKFLRRLSVSPALAAITADEIKPGRAI